MTTHHTTDEARADAERWLPFGVADPETARLFCFPNAGASAAAYASWRDHAAPGTRLCPVQPPGRAERTGEPPHDNLDDLLDDLLDGLGPELTGRFALYGHSAGALVAYGLACRLRALGATMPVHLFVSGRQAPHLPSLVRPLHDLETDEIIPELRRIGGTPEQILTEPGFLEMFLPLLRADFAMNETYGPGHEEPLDIPLTAFGGTEDPRVGEAEIRDWEARAGAGFAAHLLPGGHFFVHDHARALVAQMTDALVPSGSGM